MIFIFFITLFFLSENAYPEEQFQIEPIFVLPENTFNDPGIETVEISGSLPAAVPVSEKANSGSLDLQHRGIPGVQADMCLMGSSFNETGILLNGFNITDVQTEHHNLDVPFTAADLDRIEIIRGPSIFVSGNALAGAVNFVTRRTDGPSLISDFSYGGFNTQTVLLSFSHPCCRVSLEGKKSGGFRYDTDFKSWTISTVIDRKDWSGSPEITTGYSDKEFGAFDFYTPGKGMPSKEWTKTFFSGLDMNYKTGEMVFKPGVYYRRHFDRFMLDVDKPGWFENTHAVQTYGVKIPFRTGAAGISDFGADAEAGQITSSNLGEHRDYRIGLYAGQSIFWIIRADLAVRYDFHSVFGEQYSPSLNLSYDLNDLTLYSGIGRTFRFPSYTDLYYYDPANAGNPDLRKEHAWTADIGGKGRIGKNFVYDASSFFRCGRDVIDWVKSGSGWSVVNHDISIWGVETSVILQSQDEKDRAGLKYAFNRPADKQPFELKYAYLEHRFEIFLACNMFLDIETELTETFAKRSLNAKGYFLSDILVSKRISLLKLYAGINNLENAVYEEIPGVKMPGRFLFAGIKTDIDL